MSYEIAYQDMGESHAPLHRAAARAILLLDANAARTSALSVTLCPLCAGVSAQLALSCLPTRACV